MPGMSYLLILIQAPFWVHSLEIVNSFFEQKAKACTVNPSGFYSTQGFFLQGNVKSGCLE